MGVFSDSNSVVLEQELSNPDSLYTSFLIDEVAHMDDEARNKFLAEQAPILEAKGILGKRTIVRLSRMDDLSRRKNVAAIQLAKDKNDRLWIDALKARKKYKEYLAKIYVKYDSKSNQVAKKGQQEYIRNKHKFISTGDLSKDRETAAVGLGEKQ